MKKSSNIISTFLLFLLFSICSSCEQDEILQNENILKHTEKVNANDLGSINDSIVPLELDSTRFAEYINFKNQQTSTLNQQIKALTRATNSHNYYYTNTIVDNIYAIRDMPINIQVRNCDNLTDVELSTNGKGKELKFLTRREDDRRNIRFYFKAVPLSLGTPFLLYSYTERMPITVGTYSKDRDNPVLYLSKDESVSAYMSSFTFLPSNTSGYLIWQSNALIAQGNSDRWDDIYYKVAESRNRNKTGFSQYIQKPTQKWKIIPTVYFTVDDITYSNSYNTRVISCTDEKVTQAIENTFYNKVIPESWIYFNRNVKEESSFKTQNGISFRLSNNKKYRLPSVLKNRIITLPSQDSPLVGIYANRKQFIDKQLNSFIKLNNLKPRERCTATFIYKRYEIEVDFSVEISCIYNSENRKTKLKGVWKGIVYVDERDDVYYEFTNIDTNELLETGYLDISNIARSKSANNVPTINKKLR